MVFHIRPTSSTFELRMREQIKARVALPCTLRSPASFAARLDGATEELTRERLLVILPSGLAAESLRPGLSVVAEVQLPVPDGRSARCLSCAATVRSVERSERRVRAVLDVSSMSFSAPKPGAGGRHPP
jgi:hypothetical protein